MAAPTQLTLYNGALRLCRQPMLSATTDLIDARYQLDNVWGSGGADTIDYCLEQGQWIFARRTAELSFDPSFTAPFGLQYAFNKPSDWVRTAMVCSDPYFTVPLTQYSDEVSTIYADITPIYFMYISNDPSYGANFTEWPQTFVRFVEAYLAREIVNYVTGSDEVIKDVMAKYQVRLTDARSKMAMNEATAFTPIGSWVRARRGRSGYIQDGGSASNLIG